MRLHINWGLVFILLFVFWTTSCGCGGDVCGFVLDLMDT